MKKLLIWDFDGVIADSEKLWVQSWIEVLKTEKNIVLTDSEIKDLLVGVSDKTRCQRLEKHISNLILDNEFMQKIHEKEYYLGSNFMTSINGVENVMANTYFEHCIATGATSEQHQWKMKQFEWIRKYMSDQDFFTVDMVTHGKPAPDLFLLAAKTKKYHPSDCIVIGDSVNDFMAAKSANMDCIAFVGATGNNTDEYINKCKTYDIFDICDNMDSVNTAINRWLKNKI